MDPFAPRGDAALDYWFCKFHVGDLAFLADVIVRRGTGSPETRVSWWVRGSGSVRHAPSSVWSASSTRVRVGDAELGPRRSVGQVGEVRWDLHWSLGEALVSPLRGVVARLEPFDTSIVVWPGARFTGSVQVGPERFDVADVPEGIIQTMCADLEVDGTTAVPGSVGLEVRGYPHPRPGSA